MYKSFLSVISSSGELGDGLPDGILELIVLLAMMLIGGIVAVVVVSIVKKHKAQTRMKFGLSEPTLFSDEKFQYDPNWAATKQAKRQKFQALPHLKQELIKGATITETRKGGFEDSCKRMAAKPLYNPASARQLAALFLSELQDNSAEWVQVSEKVKAAYPHADTSTWDTLEGFFAYAANFCLDCGAPLAFGAIERETRVEQIERVEKVHDSYTATVDTGIRIGYTPVYAPKIVNYDRKKTIVEQEGEYMYVNVCRCSKCNKEAFRGENQLTETKVDYTYVDESRKPDSYDSNYNYDDPPKSHIIKNFRDVTDAVFYSQAFLPIKNVVSAKLYDFLSNPSYLPVCNGSMPQLKNLKIPRKR